VFSTDSQRGCFFLRRSSPSLPPYERFLAIGVLKPAAYGIDLLFPLSSYLQRPLTLENSFFCPPSTPWRSVPYFSFPQQEFFRGARGSVFLLTVQLFPFLSLKNCAVDQSRFFFGKLLTFFVWDESLLSTHFCQVSLDSSIRLDSYGHDVLPLGKKPASWPSCSPDQVRSQECFDTPSASFPCDPDGQVDRRLFQVVFASFSARAF